MYDVSKPEDVGEQDYTAEHPDARPVRPETTVSEFKREMAGRTDLSPEEQARRFADDMPLDARLNE